MLTQSLPFSLCRTSQKRYGDPLRFDFAAFIPDAIKQPVTHALAMYRHSFAIVAKAYHGAGLPG